MHETIFSKEIIRVIKDKLKDLDNNSKIACVNVRLSPLSHVSPQTLKSAFLQVASVDGLGSISLNVKSSAVELECKSCSRKFLVKEPFFICTHCNSKDFNVKEEREFFVESVEIEKKTEKDSG